MIITEVAGVNWILPNFKDEYGEVAEAHGKMGERYHAHFPNQETWSAKARLGSKQQVQSNWNVKNTGAFDGTPINEIPEEQRLDYIDTQLRKTEEEAWPENGVGLSKKSYKMKYHLHFLGGEMGSGQV